MRPLADEIRPRDLDEVVGQKHILGPDGLLRRVIDSGNIPNMVFYGPSGTGKTTVANIIARKTDRTLRRLNATNASLADIKSIIAELDTMLAPGGVLLYSTCTILRRENEAVAEDFLRTHPDFVPENAPWPEGSGIAPGAMVTLLPGQHETDGFFICKFRRKP